MNNGKSQPGKHSSEHRLVLAYQSSVIWNGVTTTDDNRVFVCFPHWEGELGICIGEIISNGTVIPYPDASWNAWKPGECAASTFVRTSSLRIGPDRNLWVVDTGMPEPETGIITDGPKLIVINPAINQLIRVISLAGVVKPASVIDDLRITASHIYLTDAGAPALIVPDRQTGLGRRLLGGNDSVTDTRPMLAEGKIMRQTNGQEVHIHADQLEVSPDGMYLYFQPASGLMSRIETAALNNASLSPADLASQIQLWFDTPTTGGTAIDADGNLYVSDVNQSRILKITSAGKASVLIADPRLIWVSALWIDNQGFLWLPVAQLNRTARFQQGSSTVDFPVPMYKLRIQALPVRN